MKKMAEEIRQLRDELEVRKKAQVASAEELVDLNQKLKAQTALAKEHFDTKRRLGIKIDKLEEENRELNSRLAAKESKTRISIPS